MAVKNRRTTPITPNNLDGFGRNAFFPFRVQLSNAVTPAPIKAPAYSTASFTSADPEDAIAGALQNAEADAEARYDVQFGAGAGATVALVMVLDMWLFLDPTVGGYYCVVLWCFSMSDVNSSNSQGQIS